MWLPTYLKVALLVVLGIPLAVFLLPFVLPFVLLMALVIAMATVSAWDDFNTADLTKALLASGTLNLKTAVGGDLFCAFPPRAVGALGSMITPSPWAQPDSPFLGYATNRWREVDARGVWTVVAFRKRARRAVVYTLEERYADASESIDGGVPCGPNLTIRLLPNDPKARAVLENVEIEDFSRYRPPVEAP